jgi:methylamine dehydrogenase heavy chain
MSRPIYRSPFVLIMCLAATAVISGARGEIPAEPMPSVATLEADYPDSLVFVHDANFSALIAGRVALVDVAPDSHNYKGALDASQFPSFIESRARGELYVGETHYSRGTRGDRTDVLSIYDKKTLNQTGEILLPGGKRGQVVTNRYTLQLVDNDRFLFLFNFTPAASVLMIDMESRTILSETQIPGCSLMYPTGKRGFSSLCSNGSMLSVQFDNAGQVIQQEKLPKFFNVDEDPLFDKPIYVDQTAYFPTFLGQIQAIDLSGATARLGSSWSLLSDGERRQNWRPGGWQIGTVNDAGLIYILMHRDGKNGSHKSSGSEVWVFDPVTEKRVHRYELENWGVSVEVTRGNSPFLVVTNADMQLDIYDANNGKWLKMIGGVAAMPFNLHALR